MSFKLINIVLTIDTLRQLKLCYCFLPSDNKKYKRTASAVRAPSMADYVEQRLTEMHYSAVDYRFCPKLIGILAAVAVLCLLPYLHIGEYTCVSGVLKY